MALSREQSLNVSLSLLLHACVLAVAMGAPLWGAPPVRPLSVVYNVNLVTLPRPAAPPAPAAAPTPAPAAPQAAPAPAPRAVAPPPPEEELTLPGRSRSRRTSPPAEATPAPVLRPAPAPAPTPAPQAIVPTPFAASSTPAAPGAAAAANGTDVEAATASVDPAAATYTAIISERVRGLWEPPGQGRVVVNARVLRSRFVRDVVVVRPSGNPLFDMSAVRAIQEAVPYPPFPPLMREEYVDIAFTFTGKEGLR